MSPKLIVSAIACIAGVVGAFFWWMGSTREKLNMEAFVHWKIVEHEKGPPSHVDTYPYLERLGWWNKWAAVATAISVIAGTIANFL